MKANSAKVSIAEHIANAMDSLTEKNWHKGAYFYAKDDTICMCAHGALQAQVNDGVKTALAAEGTATDKKYVAAEVAAMRAAGAAEAEEAAAAAAAAAAATAAAVEAEEAAAAVQVRSGNVYEPCLVFEKRSEWCRRKNLDAHYILGMAGLTASFNDSPSTTLDDLKKKFTEAEAIAVKLGLGPVATSKPKRTEKQGTKRYYAKLFRDGASFLESHEHTSGYLIRRDEDGTCRYCAMGAVAAASVGENKTETDYSDWLDTAFNSASWWNWIKSAEAQKLVQIAAKTVAGPTEIEHLRIEIAHLNANIVGVNDCVFSKNKTNMVRTMRLMAYMLEHGGKLPKSYQSKAKV